MNQPTPPPNVNITNGIPSEIYVGIGRDHYEDQYEVAEAVARSFAKQIESLAADNARHIEYHGELLETVSRLRRELQIAQDKAAERFNALVEMADRWSDAVDEAREVEAENEMDAATMRRCIGELRGKLAAMRGPRAVEIEQDTIDGV